MSDEAKAKEVYHNDYTGEYTYFPDHDAFTLGLFIPNLTLDEAREFLEAVEGIAEHTKIWELRDKARALLATLPEK